jgi:hypothetical protein
MEVEQLNRRNARWGGGAVEPIYTAEDATACLTQFRPVSGGEWVEVAEGFRARYWNSGHLLGSASIEIEVQPVKSATEPLRFRQALDRHGRPDRVVVDGSQTNHEAIASCANSDHSPTSRPMPCRPLTIGKNKYLNNLIEQDHRRIKRRIRPMLGFKSVESAATILRHRNERKSSVIIRSGARPYFFKSLRTSFSRTLSARKRDLGNVS